MTRENYYQTMDCENAVLRDRYMNIKKASACLVEKLERYLRQECLRSELVNTMEETKEILK